MKPSARSLALVTLALMMMAPAIAVAQTPAPTPPPAAAPDDGDLTSEVALTRAAIQVRRQALVTAAMDLDGKEAEAFWPLYRDYRNEMAKVGDRLVKLINDYADAYDTITDEQAGRMLDEYLSIQRATNEVKAAYVPRFRQILPARKVARFFQVDNKLDAVIQSKLAAGIPLVR
ncbi:MAG TPA: hypothetical protein VMQ51_20395 [Candidatus Binatia bacterium]|nr:hypothetical protein [Candidatus Binatia bacterium]